MEKCADIEKFIHWQSAPKEIKQFHDLFQSIPEECRKDVLKLMELAYECGTLDEHDKNNPDL